MATYRITNLLPANEFLLCNDTYLVLLYATRIPPHLLISINGTLFTLSVKGATVDGHLPTLLQLIRKKKIATAFIRLPLPHLFAIEQLKKEIRNCTLAYPRVGVGIATCLSPINDFCHSVYKTEKKDVNLIFDLLPKLHEKKVLNDCYHLNMEPYLQNGSFSLNPYEVNDVYEAIRMSSAVMA